MIRFKPASVAARAPTPDDNAEPSLARTRARVIKVTARSEMRIAINSTEGKAKPLSHCRCIVAYLFTPDPSILVLSVLV